MEGRLLRRPFFMTEIREYIEPVKPEPKVPIYRREEKPEEGPAPLVELAAEEEPLEIFERENDQLYIAKYLKDENPFFDYASAGEDLRLIDIYLKEEIRVNAEKPIAETYLKHYKKLRKKLGLSKDSEPEAIIQVLTDFIRDFNIYRRRFEREMREGIFKKMLKEAKIEIGKENEELFNKLTMEEQENYLKKRNLWE